MKIALIAPLEESIPPQMYGGIERVVYHIARLLGQRGHQVDLYASGDSEKNPAYTLIPIVKTSLRITEPFNHNLKMRESAKLLGIADTMKELRNHSYDIIHNHAGWRFLAFANLIETPIVTTHHNPLSYDYQNTVFRTYKDLPHVSISDNQRRDLPELNYVKTVYNGTDTTAFTVASRETDTTESLLFLARMSPDKGAIAAADVAKRTGTRLHVAAKVDEVDKPYFEQFKKSADPSLVDIDEELDEKTRLSSLQNAHALLAPIQWEEPFGLMFTEAMACGTPVIAYARGAAPEIIEDGVTGFLVNQSEEYMRGDFHIKQTGVEGLCEAVKRIYALSPDAYDHMRRAARARIEKQFTVERMVDQYEALYKEIIEKNHANS